MNTRCTDNVARRRGPARVPIVCFFVSAAITMMNAGCLVPIPLKTENIDLPGWGHRYHINNPDGSPHHGDYLLVVYHVEREMILVPVRHDRELHLIPIENGVARTPPKRIKKMRWFTGIDAWWGDCDFIESYVLIPAMHPIDSSPPDWYLGGIANSTQVGLSEGMPEGMYITSSQIIHAYLFDAPTTLVPVPAEQFYRDHYTFLRQLSRASTEFHGYQVFGPDGALEILEAFGKAELARYGYTARDGSDK